MNVTIVMPLYNGGKYLKNTLTSILTQTFSEFELIISNDNSTDNSLEIIRSMDDDRITVINNSSNLGLVGNWNQCLKIAKAKDSVATLLICQDDILDKEYLEKKMKVIQKYPEVVIVSNATRIIDEKGNHIITRKTMKQGRYKTEDIYCKVLNKGNIFGEPAVVLLRTEVIKKAGDFSAETIYTMDLEYFLRVARYGDSFFLDDVLSSFRVSKEAQSSKLLKKNNLREENDYIANKIYSYLGRKENIIKKWIRYIRFWIKTLIKKFIFKWLS